LPESVEDAKVLKRYKTKYIWFDFIVFNATFSNMSATSWRPVLVDYRSTRREPPTRDKQLITLLLAAASRMYLFM
jgi:hypothetical protein